MYVKEEGEERGLIWIPDLRRFKIPKVQTVANNSMKPSLDSLVLVAGLEHYYSHRATVEIIPF